MNELSALCDINMYDLIFISEIWFTEISASQLNNYSPVKKSRINHDGGVAIYIKRDLVVNEVSDRHLREILNNSNSEQIWCEIKIDNEIVLIGCVYRPPLSNINDINKTIISAKQAVDRKAYSCMLLAEQLVDFSTFEASIGKAKNILDLNITDLSTRVINLSSSLPLGNSSQGHRILSWDYVVLSKNETTFSNKKYDFNKGDYIIFGKKIMETNWKQLFENKNTNECYELFCNKYNKLSKQFIPLKKVHTTRNAPWMKKEVLAMIKQKKQLGNYLSATNWRSATLNREYKKLRSQVQKTCKRRVRVFEAQLASDKSNPKRVYAYAKAQQNVHVSISAISNAKGETLTEGIHIANRLNEHFKSVFVDDSKSSQLPIFERRHYQEDLGDITINFEATLAYLKGLNPNKSIGADNLVQRYLKNAQLK
ncbi:uncharacterized protein LOC136079480 [Hydra vulgaris]|uniref:Uncharacterized protein LOC136079480 n=1 Tax=Hydra vulgaris TaxID=6087 RepID=A0ABM4BQ77_HYDVU